MTHKRRMSRKERCILPSELVGKSIHDLSDEDPLVRKSALVCLNAFIWDDIDITPALPALEKALYDDMIDIRRNAAAILHDYALLTYGVDVSSKWAVINYFSITSSKRIDFSPSLEIVSTAMVCAGHVQQNHNPLRERVKAIRLPYETGSETIPLHYTPDIRQLAHANSKHDIMQRELNVYSLGKVVHVNHAVVQFSSVSLSGMFNQVNRDQEHEESPVIILPCERSADVMVTPFASRLQIEYSGSVVAFPMVVSPCLSSGVISAVPYADIQIIADEMQTDLCTPPAASSRTVDIRNVFDFTYKAIRKTPHSLIFFSAFILIVLTVIFSTNQTSVSSIAKNNGIIKVNPVHAAINTDYLQGNDNSALSMSEASRPRKLKKSGLVKPRYLSTVKRSQKRFIATESSVFQVIKDTGDGNTGFVSWFNAMNDIQKRGFILFIRSKALTRVLGNKISFSRNQWGSGESAKISRLTKTYLEEHDLLQAAKEYGPLYRLAEIQRDIFLAENRWLITYLEGNYTDFYDGLFFFFSEHGFAFRKVYERSQRFSLHEADIKKASQAVIAYRGKNIRISPKKYVKNGQIREIVAGAFFAESFYEVPADFITLISAYETNFSMKFWRGGQGTTQQTIRAANTVLQSEYWIRKLNEAAGVTIRMQLVPISALDNVFLCVSEAAKTISIKAAEIQIKTEDISSHKKVWLAGKSRSAAYVTAYKYNGSEMNAMNYAQEIQRHYAKRSHWLQAFPQREYNLLSYNK